MTTVGLLARLLEGYEHLDFKKVVDYGELISNGLEAVGTAFAYRHPNLFITAAHTVKDLDPARLRILHGDAPTEVVRSVKGVSYHPEADIAALHLIGDSFSHFTQPSPGNLIPVEVGMDVFAFGFPEDAFSIAGTSLKSVPRLFKGHVQRMMRHESIQGYEYAAAELNFPCPSGLSGGPVYASDHPELLVGLATSSLRSSTYVDSIVNIDELEPPTSELHRVVEYGVCLLLPDVNNWLSLEFGSAGSA